MVMTENHGYNRPEQGTDDWHIPLNENFERLDRDIEIRDITSERNTYDPKDGALFLATDTGDIYLGDGTSWNQIGSINSGSTTAKGIANVGRHVGPLHAGSYHDNTWKDDPRFGPVFWAKNGLTIHSIVFDTDLSSVNVNTMPIEFRRYHAEGDTELLDTSEPTLEGGPQRIQVDFTVPDDDNHNEYMITRGPTNEGTTDEEIVPCRRILNWQGWDDYSNREEDGIDLLHNTHATVGDRNTEADLGEHYYFPFDMEVGPATTRVTSPWSHDVEEIYMRPRDPEEEFDNISPRSLWIDTS